MESVTVVTEPLLHQDFVQFDKVPILERLSQKYDVTLAAPRIAPEVQEELERRHIHPADGGAHFLPIRTSRDEIPSFIGSWARDALWGWNRRDIERAIRGNGGIRINVSMTTAIDADVWFIQSRPLGVGLQARRGLTLPLRVAMAGASPFVGPLDLHHLLDAGRRAKVRYSTTQHVADWFGSKGLPVKGVLPMYYRPTLHRTSAHPSRDYILVYIGKETDSAALRMLLDTGLPVTMFGSKSVGWVKAALRLERYPHARLLGHLSDEELSDVYSNARFTAFPFTEEPFGLVPVESMACGTPVLTYGEQGPRETVIDGRTGWLVRTPQEFVRRAMELWHDGFPSTLMVDRCLTRARNYHLDTIRFGWDQLIEFALASSGEETKAPRLRPSARPEWTAEVTKASPTPAFSIGSGFGGSIPASDVSLHIPQPAVSVTEFTTTKPTVPRLVTRSGAYHDLGTVGRKGVPPEEASSDEVVVSVPTADPPREPGGSRGSATPRRTVTDGSPSSPL